MKMPTASDAEVGDIAIWDQESTAGISLNPGTLSKVGFDHQPAVPHQHPPTWEGSNAQSQGFSNQLKPVFLGKAAVHGLIDAVLSVSSQCFLLLKGQGIQTLKTSRRAAQV